MPAPQRIARYSGAALAACLLLAACGGGETQDDSTAEHGNPNTPSAGAAGAEAASESLNWAGYVKTGGIGAFTSISGSWVVPDLQCGTDNANSSTWIGIGGGVTGDPTLIQAGTEQDCRGSDKFFGAWWEALPLPQVPAEGAILVTGNFPVAPGDHVSVSIDSNAVVVWQISIVNATQGWTFNQTVPYVAAGDTAEWIAEAPLTAGTSGTGQLPLANFGRMTFSGLTVNGAPAALASGERVNMVDGGGAVLASPSHPGSGGTAFDVCHGSGAC